MLQAEQVLQGRYRLQHKLGQNPSRQTWLAQDIQTSPTQNVVVKLLAFNPQMHWDEIKLFEREAQVLKHLNDPQIPSYHDYFSIDQHTGGDLPWFGLVQEYIPGNSLQQLLDKGKRFTQVQAQRIARQVLKILIGLHELSPPVFHRDIKPSNLILGEDEQVYLVDFGAVQDRATAEGATFTVVGTSGYAPPEQLWGRAIPASDLYALGATLIHLLTGTAPANLPQRQMRIQFVDKVSLEANFISWLEKLTEPAAERRFESARQALAALKSACFPKQEPAHNPLGGTADYGRLASLTVLQLLGVAVFAAVLPQFLFAPPQPHQPPQPQAKVNFAPMNHAQQTHQSKAKDNVAAMNHAQQTYQSQHKTFTDSVMSLGIDVPTQSDTYDYSIQRSDRAVFNYGISQQDKLKSYVGGVFSIPATDFNLKANPKEIITMTILCEAESAGDLQLANPTYQNGEMACGVGTVESLE